MDPVETKAQIEVPTEALATLAEIGVSQPLLWRGWRCDRVYIGSTDPAPTAAALADRLLAEVEQFSQGLPVADDRTLVILKVK